jgi:hypothetical protein
MQYENSALYLKGYLSKIKGHYPFQLTNYRKNENKLFLLSGEIHGKQQKNSFTFFSIQ